MPNSAQDAYRINLHAKRQLGEMQKEDKQSEDDFMEQCISDMEDQGVEDPEEVCQIIWEEQGEEDSLKEIAPMQVVHKAKVSEVVGDEFILSDATVDRYGDSIDANGWVFENFNKNPIALFNHQSGFPIGTWTNIKVKDDALRAQLKMAPAGTSQRIDELRALRAAGVLKAVSVGFIPLSSTAIKDEHGYFIGTKFIKQELIETSLVSIPANPNALEVAKALRISDDTLNMVFAKHGTETVINRGVGGDTTMWQGKIVPVKRFVAGEWRGQKTYRY